MKMGRSLPRGPRCPLSSRLRALSDRVDDSTKLTKTRPLSAIRFRWASCFKLRARSRMGGTRVAAYFSKLAERRHPELPQELRHLAWLDLDQEEGQEYWHAMELMGRFASVNHDRIHHHIGRTLGATALLSVENHHRKTQLFPMS